VGAAPDPDQEDDLATNRVVDGPTEPAILPSKLTLPVLDSAHLPRPRHLAALEAGRSRHLTLVAAPAGFGKTQLLVEWCRGNVPMAWLTLDAHDNDPVRFWAHLVHALQAASPTRFRRALALLAEPGADLRHAVLPALLNELGADAHGPGLRLVLDDFHVIAHQACLESIGFFLDRRPPGLQVVVATQVDPPLGLAHLRARGELAELRAVDLRFTSAEAAAYLTGRLGSVLGATELARLSATMDGWPTGLHLAAHAVRDHSDPRGFVAAFAGVPHRGLEYLGGALLDRLPSADRDFLVQAAVLERLSAPLCGAVLGDANAAERLRRLARGNVFVTALDGAGAWYRLHPPVRELLLVELQQRFPDRTRDLHQRAAAWYRAADDAESAMAHALAAGDDTLVGDLFVAFATPLVRRGQLATLLRWLDALPKAALATRPPLALAAAWVAALGGRAPAVVTAHIALAAAGPDVGPYMLGEPSLVAAVALARAVHVADDVGAAVADAAQAVAAATDRGVPAYLLARLALGQALYLAGRADEARSCLEAARRAPLASEQPEALSRVLALLALVGLGAGESTRAAALGQRAVALLEERRLMTHPSGWLSHAALALALARAGRPAAAAAALARGVEPQLPWLAAWPLLHALALLALAPVRHARGQVHTARALVAAARAALQPCPDPGMLPSLVTATEEELGRAPERRTARSAAEMRLLRLLASDRTPREMDGELDRSVHTVETPARTLDANPDAACHRPANGRSPTD
jgi:LuxR family maltose regulon positive regulatory protein